MATTYELFTPGGVDPLTIGPFPDGTLIHSVWAPSPTNLFKVLVPNPAGSGYVLLYQLQELSGEIVSFGNNGYTSIQIQSDGTGGAAFYVAATDQIWAPYKEGPVLTVPPTIDLSAIGVYNYLKYGAISGGTNTQNDLALTEMFSVMSALAGGNGGGWGWFPPGTYSVLAQSVVPPNQSILTGMGSAPNNGSASTTFSIGSPGTFWDFSGSHTAGGVTVRGLAFGFLSSAQNSGSLAINANQENIKVIECTFQDCPTAVQLNALSSSVEDCTIIYNGVNGGSGPTGAMAQVTMGAPQVSVRGREFRQTSASSGGGPSGIAGISIGGQPCEHATIENIHLSYHDYGITYVLHNGAGYYTHATKVEIQSAITALYMVPAASNFSINGERYTDCIFKQVNNPVSATPGVVIDTNGGANANVDDIEFKGCNFISWILSDGIHINQGQNIRFKGGTMSNNGTASAGCAITGPVGDVDFEGVNMQPFYANIPNPGVVQSQLYALRLGGLAGITGIITVRGCDWTGYSGSPLLVGTSAFAGGKLYVNLTKGYNDGTQTIASAPTSSTSAQAHGFYGPTRFAASGITSYTRNGVAFATTECDLILTPYETILINTASPTTYAWTPIWA